MTGKFVHIPIGQVVQSNTVYCVIAFSRKWGFCGKEKNIIAEYPQTYYRAFFFYQTLNIDRSPVCP